MLKYRCPVASSTARVTAPKQKRSGLKNRSKLKKICPLTQIYQFNLVILIILSYFPIILKIQTSI